MILLIGLVLVVSLSSVSADCDIINGTLAEGQVAMDSGCHQTVCENGELVKKKRCPEGFELIKWGGPRSSCVKIIRERMDWTSAYKSCAQLSVEEEDVGKASLVEAANKFEYSKTLSYANKYADEHVNGTENATNILFETTTAGSLLRELNSEEEEDVLDRWDIRQQVRSSEEETSPCGSDMTCMNGDECATGSFCNNIKECSDNSDEYFCGGRMEYWMGANNKKNPNVISWVTSSVKVKEAPVPDRGGLCLGVAFGERSLFDCDFEGLYPMCEVCSSQHKIDNGCEYNDELYGDGKEVDRQECAKLFCRKGDIEEEMACPPGYDKLDWDGGSGCYKFYDGEYTNQHAKENLCKAPVGLKRMALLSGDKEGSAILQYLNDKGASSKSVWVGHPLVDECHTLTGADMKEEADCNKTLPVLCESCFTEAEQEEAEPEHGGCKFHTVDFDIGDQLEPDKSSCTATVCKGQGDWKVEYFGSGCCEVNDTIIKPGPTDESKLVADEEGDDCREVNCKNGEFINKDITCGCKGTNNDIYPHKKSISKDYIACQERWCNAGTIATKSLPVTTCSKCRWRGRSITRTKKSCYWLSRKTRCQVVTCLANGKLSRPSILRASACRRSYRWVGCR